MIELGTPKAGTITVGYVPTCRFGWWKRRAAPEDESTTFALIALSFGF